MNKNVLYALLSGCALLLAVSCASTPADAPDLPGDIAGARATAEEARTRALEMKADVAVAEMFTGADTVFEEAKESEAAEATEAAVTAYNSATELFTAAYNEAKAKRDAALSALDTAERERITTEDVLRTIEEEQNSEQEGSNE